MAHKGNLAHSQLIDLNYSNKAPSYLDLLNVRELLLQAGKANSQDYQKSEDAISNNLRDIAQSFLRQRTFENNVTIQTKPKHKSCGDCEMVGYLKVKIKALKQ